MKRNIYKKLLSWKNSDRRKPLILQGARQIGKTYILRDFAKREYNQSIYINFEDSSKLINVLKEELSVTEILKYLKIFHGQEIIPNKTLIFFDEIQSAPYILKSLKYFQEKFNEYHIVTAGSLLGVTLTGKTSFPVGKVNFLDMYPLSFSEFLTALGEEVLLTLIPASLDEIIPMREGVHAKLIEYLKLYYFIGGMPEVVNDYCRNENFSRVREIQLELIKTYLNDFSKHTTKSEAIKIRQIWSSIPLYLGKENKAFVFSAIKASARAREYETALQWLLDAGLILKVSNISRPLKPLSAYIVKQFKIYFLDVGLLGAITDVHPDTIMTNDELFTHFKGALTENFVAQELIMSSKPYYWSNQGKAEVDFIINNKKEVYPLEVKAGINLNSKSLKIFDELFSPSILLRSSLANFEKNNKYIDIPLYALSKILNNLNTCKN